MVTFLSVVCYRPFVYKLLEVRDGERIGSNMLLGHALFVTLFVSPTPTPRPRSLGFHPRVPPLPFAKSTLTESTKIMEARTIHLLPTSRYVHMRRAQQFDRQMLRLCPASR